MEAPHWRDWEWTQTEKGENGGHIIKAEIDVNNVEQAADRVGKILGKTGADDRKIQDARSRINNASSAKDRKEIVESLIGNSVAVSFVKGNESEAAAEETATEEKESSKKKSR